MIRVIGVGLLFLFSGIHAVQAADTPVIVEDELGGAAAVALLPQSVAGERNTCDRDFWEVMSNRAWMEGQREITQNANLIPRAESTLSLNCFDRYLNHLAWHADDHFPSDPDYSEGGLGNFAYELFIQLDELTADIDPRAPSPTSFAPRIDLFLGVWIFKDGSTLSTGGLLMYPILELLVLDQLVDGVSDLHILDDAINFPVAFGLCEALSGDYKEYYLDETFPQRALGGRAITRTTTPGPAYTEIFGSYGMSDVHRRPYNFNDGNQGCQKMNQIWMRAKCYDFATESELHSGSTAPPREHDGFYPFSNVDGISPLDGYVEVAAAGNDLRMLERMCEPPNDEGLPDLPSLGELACQIAVHGLPTGVSIGQIINIINLLNNENPVWDDDNPDPGDLGAYSKSYPDPNPAPYNQPTGAADEYTHYLELRDTFACAPPIETGYLVKAADGRTYKDAVCPSPGCWFVPPTAPATNGTCN